MEPPVSLEEYLYRSFLQFSWSSIERDNREQKKRLKAFFKKFESSPGEPVFDDPELYGDLWEYKAPCDIEYWSIALTPMTHHLALVTKWERGDINLPISLDEYIVDIVLGPSGYICVTCVVDEKDQDYRFSYMINALVVEFNIWPHIHSLKDSQFEALAKNVEQHAREFRFTNERGEQHAPDVLAPRLRNLLTAMTTFKAKLNKTKAQMQPLRLTQEMSIQSGSHESILYQTPDTRGSGTRRRKTNPSQSGRDQAPPKKLKAVTTKKSLLAEPAEVDPTSLASALTDILADCEKKIEDYKESMTVLKNYWAQCLDSYVFGAETMFTIPLKQLHTPPPDLNVRVLEQYKVVSTMHFLIEMADKDKKNTLCVFPKDKLVKRESWEEIMNGDFYMVNGQHCVEASKQMQKRQDVDDKIKKSFKSWECFVVWNDDKSIIRKISAYYNRVNYFMNPTPTWAKNIIGARQLWVSLGRPENPKEATEVGRAMTSGRTKALKESKDKFDEFMEAVKLRFALIDVKNTQKGVKGSKTTKEKFNIQNELKIITAPDDVYNVWSDLIVAHSQGELIDPDTGKKMKELGKWNTNHGIIAREFFKWLGNTNMAQLKRLAEHLLNKANPKRKHAYPKVTMKKMSGVYVDCYSAQDWLERTKRKTIVKRQIHNLRPDFMLVSTSGELRKEAWKKFKSEYKITPAALNVLLTGPGEEFFTQAKLQCSKNKPIEQMSPYAAEFFRVFLANKGKFQIPKASANFRAYNLDEDVLGEWHEAAWTDTSEKKIKLGVMDFRNLPGAHDQTTSSTAAPYFYNVLKVLKAIKDPVVTEIPIWAWICGSREDEAKIKNHLDGFMFGQNYRIDYSEYLPAQFERLDDLNHIAKKAKEHVQILFLFRRSFRHNLPNLPNFFQAPMTPKFTIIGRYNELQYRIYNSKLRVEFYLKLLDLFCKPGDAVLTVFGGGKLSCAASMCSLENFCICPSDEHDTFLQLSMEVLNLDRRDFESGYHVDEAEHPIKKIPEAPVPKEADKGKKKARAFEVPVAEGSSRPIIIGLSDDDAEAMRDCEVMETQVHGTPLTGHGSTSIHPQAPEQGYSDSSLPDESTPPKKKEMEPNTLESMWEKMMQFTMMSQAEHKKEVAEMLAREREERRAERQEDRHAEKEKWEYTTNMMMKSVTQMLPELMYKTYESLGARPLLSHDPSQTGQMLLLDKAANSSGSGVRPSTSPSRSHAGMPSESTPASANACTELHPNQAEAKADNMPSSPVLGEVTVAASPAAAAEGAVAVEIVASSAEGAKEETMEPVPIVATAVEAVEEIMKTEEAAEAVEAEEENLEAVEEIMEPAQENVDPVEDVMDTEEVAVEADKVETGAAP